MSLASHPVDLLLEAFSMLRQDEDTVTLLCVGGREDIYRLHEYARSLDIADSVLFTGRISPDVVATYYRLADVSVDPIRGDDVWMPLWPLKIVESWACGVPALNWGRLSATGAR